MPALGPHSWGYGKHWFSVQAVAYDGYVDLFLRPPVQGFDLLGFDAHEKLYEIGYEYTRKQLAEWDGLQRVAIGSSSS